MNKKQTNLIGNTKIDNITEIKEFLSKFLNLELKEDDSIKVGDKELRIEYGTGSQELALVGEFCKVDKVKNLIYKGNVDSTTILKVVYAGDTLLIGTHKREDSEFNFVTQMLRNVINKDVLNSFTEVDVTEKDFIGTNVFIASSKYPTNKMSRYV